MTAFQILCASVLVLAYIVLWKTDPEAMRYVPFIFIASWFSEATCIYFYEFYAYPDTWWPRLWGVPLLVAAIWPMVILSGRQVIRALWPNVNKWQPALVLAIVFFDASMVEVVAVECGLWGWSEPGYLGVPLIGVLGWAYFAASVAWLIQRAEKFPSWSILLIAPIATHGLLLTTWWGLFRWVLRGDWFWLYVAGILLAALFVWRSGKKMPMKVAGMRILAAVIFVGLLLAASPGAIRVWLHVALLAAPYMLATDFTGKYLPAARP